MSRTDASIWLVTFALTVFADLTQAVEVGMALAALLFIRTVASTTSVAQVTEDLGTAWTAAAAGTRDQTRHAGATFRLTSQSSASRDRFCSARPTSCKASPIGPIHSRRSSSCGCNHDRDRRDGPERHRGTSPTPSAAAAASSSSPAPSRSPPP